MTRIVLSSDHTAIDLRREIAAHLEAAGHAVNDIGPVTAESTHYPLHGRAAAQTVVRGEADFGVILCGTGQGIMMYANKVPGIRCGVCAEPASAALIRMHNNANMLSIGARVVGPTLALAIVDAFLEADFECGRHTARVEMIEGA